MGKATGFVDYERKNGPVRPPKERIRDFDEFHQRLPLQAQREQAARCMACGVPFCQSGMEIGGRVSGCPLHNLVPETNELVYTGNLEQAYYRLSKTHSFPEFTSRVCPALCEAACTCGHIGEPVATRENERLIIEYAYENGLVKEITPSLRTGKTVAIIGSGPSGLAAAQLLNLRGHKVTVFERSDRPGGLLRYGIPNMKLDKRVIDRRIALMEEAGIEFRCGVTVGKDITGEELKAQFDRILICTGSPKARDISVPGREAKGIYFAVDFLSEVTKKLMNEDYDEKIVKSTSDFSFGNLKDKKVIVIGGGDTGNDCVGTVIRLGASSVIQLEMMPKPPVTRLPQNPWPEWPNVLKTDYGQEEAIYCFGSDPRQYETTVKEFLQNEKGELCGAVTIRLQSETDPATGRKRMVPVEGSEETIAADLVLIAAGFVGGEEMLFETLGVEKSARGNVEAGEESYETSEPRVYAAGDARRGQSLVVWAIREGRCAAKAIDLSLMGYSNL